MADSLAVLQVMPITPFDCNWAPRLEFHFVSRRKVSVKIRVVEEFSPSELKYKPHQDNLLG